jgi:hypothetical protein
MQTSKLKTYAPKARRDFIAAVTRRAAKFGLTAKGTSPFREEGQLVFIEGQPYPKAVGTQRRKLADRIKQQSFQQVMEAAAEQAPKPGVNDDKPKPYVKRRVVKASALAPKALLETQEDVDAYLNKLRQALECAINSNECVEIR